MRHDGESRDTDRLTWSRHRPIFGGQGVRREAGSEGLEENRSCLEASHIEFPGEIVLGGVRVGANVGASIAKQRFLKVPDFRHLEINGA